MSGDQKRSLLWEMNWKDTILDCIEKVIKGLLNQPLYVAQTLIQLGYEPFKVSIGKRWIMFGRDTVFLPNIVSYCYQLAHQHGYSILFTGLASNCIGLCLNYLATFRTIQILNRDFPNFGGSKDLTIGHFGCIGDWRYLRRIVRDVIRVCVAMSVGIFVSRPFTVLTIRMIAQNIGTHVKYHNIFQSIPLIIEEEGFAGFFSGVSMEILTKVLHTIGYYSIIFLTQRILLRTRIGNTNHSDLRERQIANSNHKFAANLIWYIYYPPQNTNILACVMALSGSGLLSNVYPYSSYSCWQDAYDSLYPVGLSRFSSFFLRPMIEGQYSSTQSILQ